jgi:hypothetical protein
MNKRITEFVEQAETKEVGYYFFDREKFAKLIIQECIDNLFFHGHDEAANQLEWLRVNRFGFKE